MFTFSDYTLRATTEDDRALCAAWIEADADHRGKVEPDFFIKQQPGIECFVLEDKHGQPVFYFRMSRPIRVDIQFGPATNRAEKKRNADALEHGFGWLKEIAAKSGYRQIIFESQSDELAFFCKARFGFHKSLTELVCDIAPPETNEAQEKAVQPLQQQSQERQA